jgi:hypothetical protein
MTPTRAALRGRLMVALPLRTLARAAHKLRGTDNGLSTL